MSYVPPSPETVAGIVAGTHFDRDGLITAVAQDESGAVLMLAWMNAAALTETLLTGRVCYFSRSRDALWRKGETSGQIQHLLQARLDCDMDAILLTVEQKGVACHTGRRSCFFHGVTPEGLRDTAAPLVSPDALYSRSPSEV